MPKTSNPSLRAFYAKGRDLGRQFARQRASAKGVWGVLDSLGVESVSEKHRHQEARKFARLCDDVELEFLCGLKGPRKWRLSRTHVLQLCRIEDRRERKRLAALAAKKGWSTRELQREIDAQGHHRTFGGRKQKPPESIEEALLISHRIAASWLRWIEVLQGGQGTIRMSKLPPSVRQNMNQCTDAAKKIEQAISKRLGMKPPKQSD